MKTGKFYISFFPTANRREVKAQSRITFALIQRWFLLVIGFLVGSLCWQQVWAQGPAGISTGLKLWVKANAGVTGSSPVTVWADQSSNANNLTGSGTGLALVSNGLNFNPVVNTPGFSNYFIKTGGIFGVGSYTGATVFTVAKTTAAAPGAIFSEDLAAPATTFKLHLPYINGNIIIYIPASAALTYPVPASTYSQYNLWTGYATSGTQSLNQNGKSLVTGTSPVSYSGNNQPFVLATHNGEPNTYNGFIAEQLIYSVALTPLQVQEVNSYLALKWGITLDQTTPTDYVASNGTTQMWTAATGATFKNNIAGIGRDDASALYQKQSQSQNSGAQIIMGIGSVAATNAANTGVLANTNFQSWADNNGPLTQSGLAVPAGYTVTKWLTRRWQTQETGSVGSTQVQAPSDLLSSLGGGGATYLMVANDANFTTGIQEIPLTFVNGNWQANFDFTGVQYFTFGKKAVPEICNNGIDDDLNGYIDGFDPACAGVTPTCVGPSGDLPDFRIRQEWSTHTSNTGFLTSLPVTVGDLDGDGISEILATRADKTGLTKFRGNGADSSRTGITDYTFPTGYTGMPAIGDIDRDGVPEVIAISADHYIYVFNNVSGNTSTYKFKSNLPTSFYASNYASYFEAHLYMGSPRLADINEDGVPEIIVGTDVFKFNLAAGTLTRVVAGSTALPSGRDYLALGFDIVVVDILPSNPGKEIVAGSRVYGVDLVAGTLTELRNMMSIAGNNANPVYADGPTAVADLNLDGNLDVAYSDGTYFNIWTPATNTILMQVVHQGLPNGDGNSNSIAFRGMPTIANVYNEVLLDGKAVNYPEVVLTYSQQLVAFNLNKTTGPVWVVTTTDGSGATGLTTYDLNGDGVLEIIYNDETNIRVINGNTATPNNVFSFNSGTATWNEHPIIADVDKDGQAEFVTVTGGAFAGAGEVRVFGSALGSTPWQSARNLWNQRGYRPVDVNDDLTIPASEQSMMAQVPSGSGLFPLNIFNAQVPPQLILPPGTIPLPDVAVTSVTTTCPVSLSAVSFMYTVKNLGDANIPMGTPMRFYVNDPTTGAAVRLSTTDALMTPVVPDDSVSRTIVLNLSAFTAPVTVFVAANDDGSLPVPLVYPITSISECDYTNNFNSIVITNNPPIISVTSATVCVGSPLSLSATATPAGSYTYTWSGPNNYTGLGANPTVSATVSLINAGTYTVIVTNAAGCSGSATVDVVVTDCTICSLTAIAGVPFCDPGNTTYSVSVTATDATSLNISAGALSGNAPSFTISGIPAGTDVIITPIGSCTNVSPLTITAPNCCSIATPIASVTSQPTCNQPTGTITVSSPLTGVTYSFDGGLTFQASNVKSGLAAGTNYNIVVKDNTTGCLSDAVTLTVNPVSNLRASASSNSPVCTSNLLQLIASQTGGSGPITYSWSGPDNFTSTLQNPSIASPTTAAGGSYTVTVTDATCSVTATTTVTIATQPNLVISGSPSLTICSGQPTVLTVTGDGGAPVTWTNTLGESGTGTTINFGGIVNTSGQPQTIIYFIKASAGGCSDDATVLVTINPVPALQVKPSQAVLCAIEETDITATAFPSTATIIWTRTPNTPNPPSAGDTGTGSVTINQVLPAGNYTYTFTATEGGCTSAPVTVPLVVNN